jgi:hypothetical protein
MQQLVSKAVDSAAVGAYWTPACNWRLPAAADAAAAAKDFCGTFVEFRVGRQLGCRRDA